MNQRQSRRNRREGSGSQGGSGRGSRGSRRGKPKPPQSNPALAIFLAPSAHHSRGTGSILVIAAIIAYFSRAATAKTEKSLHRRPGGIAASSSRPGFCLPPRARGRARPIAGSDRRHHRVIAVCVLFYVSKLGDLQVGGGLVVPATSTARCSPRGARLVPCAGIHAFLSVFREGRRSCCSISRCSAKAIRALVWVGFGAGCVGDGVRLPGDHKAVHQAPHQVFSRRRAS